MDKQQPFQEPKLRNREVARVHRLPSFFPADAHANLGFLNHRHVVGAVANGQGNGLIGQALFHHFHDQLLLRRRDPARDHRFAKAAQLQKHVPRVLIGQKLGQRRPVHDER